MTPTAQPIGANAITETSANLIGTVNPNGEDTTYAFEYGTTDAFGSVTPTLDAGSGTGPVTVTAEITGLQPGQTYYYTVTATNADGTTTGYTLSFQATPAPLPVVASPYVPDVDTPHLDYPFTLTNTGANVVEQDSAEDITAGIRMVASTLTGSIPELPGFGIPDLTFAQVTNPDAFTNPLVSAIEAQEPRATATAIATALDDAGSAWQIKVNPSAIPETDV